MRPLGSVSRAECERWCLWISRGQLETSRSSSVLTKSITRHRHAKTFVYTVLFNHHSNNQPKKAIAVHRDYQGQSHTILRIVRFSISQLVFLTCHRYWLTAFISFSRAWSCLLPVWSLAAVPNTELVLLPSCPHPCLSFVAVWEDMVVSTWLDVFCVFNGNVKGACGLLFFSLDRHSCLNWILYFSSFKFTSVT